MQSNIVASSDSHSCLIHSWSCAVVHVLVLQTASLASTASTASHAHQVPTVKVAVAETSQRLFSPAAPTGTLHLLPSHWVTAGAKLVSAESALLPTSHAVLYCTAVSVCGQLQIIKANMYYQLPAYSWNPGDLSVLLLVLCAGYGGPDCLQCKAGFYSDGNSNSTADCTACPAGLTSQAGAPSVKHCGCAAGYGLLQTSATMLNPVGNSICSVCQPGTWSAGPPTTSSAAPLVLQTCQSCGPAKLSPLGAKSPSECVCAQGEDAR